MRAAKRFGVTNFFDLFIFAIVGDCGGETDKVRLLDEHKNMSIDLTFFLLTILIGDMVLMV